MKTVQDVKDFYAELAKQDLCFHPEDDIFDCLSYENAIKYRNRFRQAKVICILAEVDICEIALEAIKPLEVGEA